MSVKGEKELEGHSHRQWQGCGAAWKFELTQSPRSAKAMQTSSMREGEGRACN